MKRLIAFMALFLFVVNANAVTAAKSSPDKKAAATITETPVKDEKLAQQLAKEVEAEEPVVIAAVAPAQIQATPAPAAPEAQPTQETAAASSTDGDLNLDDDAIEAESLAANQAMQESVTSIEAMPKKKDKNWYISAVLGTLQYPDVSNVNGKYNIMGSLGYIWEKSFVFELGGGAANYEMESYNANVLNRKDKFEIDQYYMTGAAKYRMAFGRIVPSAGVFMQMTQRNFTQRDPNNVGNNGMTIDRGNSQTTDAGVVGAVDFEMNRDFAIGLDLRYMINVSNKADTIANVNAASQGSVSVTPIEQLQSYSAGVSARMNF
ncbi:MAG: hypothetical protein K0R29_2101 [Pseudobdellovibrio sp.]|jgi:hypothetical protein|nr:hypothetical protein [Pseudobdellovibrio sp.]